MKKFLPLVSLVLILAICAISSVLYLNQSYTSSALLTIMWVIALTYWIGSVGAKAKEAK
jgi:branched-subunit amino acid transport protein AzlD